MKKVEKEEFAKSATELAANMKWDIKDGEAALKDSETTVAALQCPGVKPEQADELMVHLGKLVLATRLSGMTAIAENLPKTDEERAEFAAKPITFDVPYSNNITVSATLQAMKEQRVPGQDEKVIKFGHVVANEIITTHSADGPLRATFKNTSAEYSKLIEAAFGKK